MINKVVNYEIDQMFYYSMDESKLLGTLTFFNRHGITFCISRYQNKNLDRNVEHVFYTKSKSLDDINSLSYLSDCAMSKLSEIGAKAITNKGEVYE